VSGSAGRRSSSASTCRAPAWVPGRATCPIRDAYSGDLKDESLDGQRVVMAGSSPRSGPSRPATRKRWPSPRSRTCRDAGSRGVPRMYATSAARSATGPSARGRRVDHRGDEARFSPTRSGSGRRGYPRPAAVAQEVAAGERSRATAAGSGRGAGNATATATERQRLPGGRQRQRLLRPAPLQVPSAGWLRRANICSRIGFVERDIRAPLRAPPPRRQPLHEFGRPAGGE